MFHARLEFIKNQVNDALSYVLVKGNFPEKKQDIQHQMEQVWVLVIWLVYLSTNDFFV